MTVDGDGGQVQITGAVLIPTDPEQPAIRGVRLTFDRRGVVVEWATTEPRIVRWEAVKGWRVDPDEFDGEKGSFVIVETPDSTFRFAATGADAVSLGYAVDALCAHFTRVDVAPAPTQDAVRPPGPRPDPRSPDAPDAPDDGLAPGRDRHARWKPVLVVVLVLVLATAVSLLLAESAGAIHWPILGGGGGTPGAMLH